MSDDSTENHVLIDKEATNEGSWTKQDFLMLIMGLMISFGDGIELYLPGKLLSISLPSILNFAPSNFNFFVLWFWFAGLIHYFDKFLFFLIFLDVRTGGEES